MAGDLHQPADDGQVFDVGSAEGNKPRLQFVVAEMLQKWRGDCHRESAMEVKVFMVSS
jgi:hypothetical protein